MEALVIANQFEDLAVKIDIQSLRPLRDYILMENYTREKSAGGVLLPEGSPCNECAVGKILKVGSGVDNPFAVENFPMDLQPGQIALTMEYMGEKMGIRQGNFRLVRSHGVWATVTLKDAESFEIDTITPRMSCVLVRPDNEYATKSGIHLPGGEDKNSPNRWATVLAVGPGTYHGKSKSRIPMEVSVGQRVLMMRYAGADVFVKGEKLRLCDQSDIRLGA
jgi:co-chaperonin GroES (HSP10)